MYEMALTAWQYQLPFKLYAEPVAQSCAEAPAIVETTIVAVERRFFMLTVDSNMDVRRSCGRTFNGIALISIDGRKIAWQVTSLAEIFDLVRVPVLN